MKRIFTTLLLVGVIFSCALLLFSCASKECKHKRSYSTEQNVIAATETSEGSYDLCFFCRDCNKEISREKKTTQKLPCTHVDSNEDFACDKCGALYVGENHTTHSYDRMVTGEKFLKSPSNCTEPAEYYLSCGCGAVGENSFSYGNPEHHFTEEKKEEEYFISDATCKSPTLYYKSCVCGLAGEETFTVGEALPHSFIGEICSVCGEEKTYTREGEYVYYGEYPRSVKKSSVEIVNAPVSMGKYLGSDGEYYVKATAAPYGASYEMSNGENMQNGKEYYFKLEPIRWRVLSEEDGIARIMCAEIIDAVAYCSQYNAFMYSGSEVWGWLNGTFYDSAFTEAEKSISMTVRVDNSPMSTGYLDNENYSAYTNDKVFILSYVEIAELSSAERKLPLTDYAMAMGAKLGYYGNGTWLSRSPYVNSGIISFVAEDAGITTGSAYDKRGVVPVMEIKLK